MESMEVANQTILVTGGTGFIGSHLVSRLIATGAKIVVPYISVDNQSFFAEKELSKKVTLELVDIRDKEKVSALNKKYKIDYIFHLAAQTLVTKAYEDPAETLETNILGTINLLEMVRLSNNIKGILVASSDKAYGKTQEAYTEDAPLKGDHPYDVSKSSTDLISLAYYKTYNIPVVVTRFGNVYGEGDLHFDRLIPGICKAILQEKVFDIRSNGLYVRDYLYVQDVVDGYLTLFKNIADIHGQAYNFSSQDTLSVLDVITEIENALGKKIQYKIHNIAKNEIPYQHLDDSKIKKLGWESKYRLKNAIVDVFSWYRKTLTV